MKQTEEKERWKQRKQKGNLPNEQTAVPDEKWFPEFVMLRSMYLYSREIRSLTTILLFQMFPDPRNNLKGFGPSL